VNRFLSASVVPGDDDVTVERKRLWTGAAAVASPLLFASGLVYLAYGEAAAAWAYIGITIWVWLNLAALMLWHKRIDWAFWGVAVVALVGQLVTTLSLGDLVHSAGLLLWGLAYPVASASLFIPVRRAIPLYAFYGGNAIVATLLVRHDRSSLPDIAERILLAINVIGLSAFLVAVIAQFVNQRNTAHRLLAEEQRRGRALLLSILPEAIADELSRAPRVIAEQFDSVSVLFADVVGFTPMSAAMQPAELVELLDDVFARFDQLVDEAGLEKIKTIGDCYMVASGIPLPRDDHATALVNLALRMQAVTRTEEFCGRRLVLRIGINSGPVVAGVIGRRKFSYDLWGDVVNTASRMESHGVPGEVQLTETTYELIADRFHCAARGSIEIRGKGALPVWLVSALKV
jgi:guanylate cyclase